MASSSSFVPYMLASMDQQRTMRIQKEINAGLGPGKAVTCTIISACGTHMYTHTLVETAPISGSNRENIVTN